MDIPQHSQFPSGGLLHTFTSSCYVGISIYGLLLVGVNILFTSFTTTFALLGLFTLIINYFKIPTTPQEQVDAVFGVDPLTINPKGFCDLRDLNDDKLKRSARIGPLLGGNGLQIHNETSVIVVGHRGSGLDAPENSLSAFRQCKARGCDIVEFDVSLTKDNVPVIFHDDDLKRICGIDRKINDIELKELKKIDISLLHPLGEKFRGEKVPTFEEAVQLLLELDMKFIIDLKDTNECIVNTVSETFVRHPQLYRQAVVSSFNAKVVYDIRRRDPKIIGCLAWRPQSWRCKTWIVDGYDGHGIEQRYNFFAYDWLAMIGDLCMDWLLPNFLWWFLGLGAILLQKDAVSKHEVVRWTRNGVRVLLWTVNNPVEKLHCSQVYQVSYLTDTLDGNVLVTKSS